MCSFFSIGSALDKGWKLSNVCRVIHIKSETNSLSFDIEISSGNKNLMGIKLVRVKPEQAMPLRTNKIDIATFHDQLGHPSEQTTRRTAHNHNIELIDQLSQCEN